MAEASIGLHHVKALGSTCAETLGLPRLGVACGCLPATVSKRWPQILKFLKLVLKYIVHFGFRVQVSRV